MASADQPAISENQMLTREGRLRLFIADLLGDGFGRPLVSERKLASGRVDAIGRMNGFLRNTFWSLNSFYPFGPFGTLGAFTTFGSFASFGPFGHFGIGALNNVESYSRRRVTPRAHGSI